MNAILKERIGERVTALKISWRRASLEAGFEAGFIQDIITGRSRVPGEGALASLARIRAQVQSEPTLWARVTTLLAL